MSHPADGRWRITRRTCSLGEEWVVISPSGEEVGHYRDMMDAYENAGRPVVFIGVTSVVPSQGDQR